MTIIKSKFPDLDIPVTDAYSYIFQHVERYSDFTALIDPTSGTKITFGQLNESILQLSNGLSTRLDKGDVVAILAPNHINYATAVFGVLKAGGCVTTLNPAYTLREIQRKATYFTFFNCY